MKCETSLACFVNSTIGCVQIIGTAKTVRAKAEIAEVVSDVLNSIFYASFN
jgi:hypothetical protein